MNAFGIATIVSFHSFHPLLLVVATTCGREAMRIGVRVTTKEWRSSYRMSSETNCVFYLGNLSMWTAVPYEVLKMLKILLVNLHPAELQRIQLDTAAYYRRYGNRQTFAFIGFR